MKTSKGTQGTRHSTNVNDGDADYEADDDEAPWSWEEKTLQLLQQNGLQPPPLEEVPFMPGGLQQPQQQQVPFMPGGILQPQQQQVPFMPGGLQQPQQQQVPFMPGGIQQPQQQQVPFTLFLRQPNQQGMHFTSAIAAAIQQKLQGTFAAASQQKLQGTFVAASQQQQGTFAAASQQQLSQGSGQLGHIGRKYRLSPCTDKEVFPLPDPSQSSTCNPAGGIVMPGSLGGIAVGSANFGGSVPRPANYLSATTSASVSADPSANPSATPFASPSATPSANVSATPSYVPGDDVMLEDLLREAAELAATSKEDVPQQYESVNDWLDR